MFNNNSFLAHSTHTSDLLKILRSVSQYDEHDSNTVSGPLSEILEMMFKAHFQKLKKAGHVPPK